MKTAIRVYLVLGALRAITGSLSASTYVKFLEIHGLNLFEINALNCFFYAALIIFDIPTGAFADVYGRKKSIIISFCLGVIGEAIYGFSSTTPGFIGAELTLALSSTFLNGALRAWAVDQLKCNGYTGTFTDLFARSNMLQKIVGVPSAIIGGYLLAKNPSLPSFTGSVVLVFGLVCGLAFVKESYFIRKKVSLKRSYKIMCLTMRISFRHVRKNRVVRFIILSSIIQTFAVQAPNMQWIPRFEQLLGGTSRLGYAMGAFMMLNALGAFFAKRILKSFRNEESMILWCQVSIGILLIGSALTSGAVGFIFFLIHQIPRGLYDPVKDAYFQHHITSRERATMSSFESVVPNTGGMLALFGTGLMAKNQGIPMTWMIAGSILIIASIVVAISSRPVKKDVS